MNKIKVENPIVELDGDEMARVMWGWIKEMLILPYLDVDLKYFDFHIKHRDDTENRVIADAAEAVKKYRVGVKCAAINPDNERVKEFGLKQAWRSPNVVIRNLIGGTLFRCPIVFANIPRRVPGWTQSIDIARHAFGGLHSATDMPIPKAGKVFIKYVPADGGDPKELEVCDLEGAGVALGMFNTTESVRGFARSCLNYGLQQGYPVYLGTKNTAIEHYDGLFKDTFQQVYDSDFRKLFEEKGLVYEHRMVDELAAFAIKSAGGFVWACKNYDGDVFSDLVAAGFGSLALMSSLLLTPDGNTALTEASHGTVTRHYREHQAGRETSTNPVGLLYAWTRGLYYRGMFDNTPDVREFAEKLEQACADTVEGGRVTKDLATLMGADSWLTTRQFLMEVKSALDKRR
ncbi:MAG: NADP-dependent isocitrate dehydrogenase [Desulfobacterales bacterium]|nr:NADP-dependent isocitrate dehydrogenase [Desulfobacterales bacterium]